MPSNGVTLLRNATRTILLGFYVYMAVRAPSSRKRGVRLKRFCQKHSQDFKNSDLRKNTVWEMWSRIKIRLLNGEGCHITLISGELVSGGLAKYRSDRTELYQYQISFFFNLFGCR